MSVTSLRNRLKKLDSKTKLSDSIEWFIKRKMNKLSNIHPMPEGKAPMIKLPIDLSERIQARMDKLKALSVANG